MGELVGAMRMLSNLGLNVMQYPSGKWGFVGRVPAELAYTTTDENILKEIVQSQSPAMTMKHYGVSKRVWENKAAAVADAEAAGYAVLNK